MDTAPFDSGIMNVMCSVDGGDANTPPSCTEYCTLNLATCTGTNQQYNNMNECMRACATFPVGSGCIGGQEAEDNTLTCRRYHTSLAMGPGSAPVVHCPHSGPGGFGTCGDDCSGYCDLVVGYCSSTMQLPVDPTSAEYANCVTNCRSANFNGNLPYNTTDMATGDGSFGHTDACLVYNGIQAASLSAGTAQCQSLAPQTFALPAQDCVPTDQ